jgi:hypothetical protein
MKSRFYALNLKYSFIYENNGSAVDNPFPFQMTQEQGFHALPYLCFSDPVHRLFPDNQQSGPMNSTRSQGTNRAWGMSVALRQHPEKKVLEVNLQDLKIGIPGRI